MLARFEVIRHVRHTCSCRKCETMVQAPMPELPIPHGMVDASFLAHMIVAKFCDHIPLYRQAEIDAADPAEWRTLRVSPFQSSTSSRNLPSHFDP